MQFRFTFGPGTDTKSKRPFMPIPIEEAAEQGIHVPLIIGYANNEGIALSKCNILFDITYSFIRILEIIEFFTCGSLNTETVIIDTFLLRCLIYEKKKLTDRFKFHRSDRLLLYVLKNSVCFFFVIKCK